MRVTAICQGAYLGGPSYSPGDHLEVTEKAASANLALFAFVRGWHDITGPAAQRVRDHYHETRERIEIAEIEGTGSGGRVLVEDVEAVIRGSDAEPVEPEPTQEYEPEVETFGSAEEE